MSRFMLGATALGLVFSSLATPQAGAAAFDRCVPHHHRAVAMRHHPVEVVYAGKHIVVAGPPGVAIEGPDLAPIRGREIAGQGASWLDGYGTRPVSYPGYGTTDTYGGSSEVWPRAILPAGGLAVYSPGAYGPGPRIIHVPGY